jgi:hypothetical protein
MSKPGAGARRALFFQPSCSPHDLPQHAAEPSRVEAGFVLGRRDKLARAKSELNSMAFVRSTVVPKGLKMWTTLIPAIVGLLGVVVGAVITTGTNYVLAVRKERAEADQRERSRANKLKTAARLIANEFFTARAAARTLVEKKSWVPTEIKFPLDAWQRDRDVIALELPLKDWNAVEIAALAVEHFRNFHTAPRSSDDASDAMAEIGKPVVRDITAGLEALKPYVLDQRASLGGRGWRSAI